MPREGDDVNIEGTSLQRIQSFSTRRAPHGEEVDYWREARREAYVSVRTDPVDSRFGGEIQLGQYPGFRLSTKWAQAEQVRRSRSDIAQGPEDQDYLYFLMQLSGDLLIEQAGRAALASPGSLVIYDSATPFRLSSQGPYKQVVLELPADDAYAMAGIDRSDYLLARRFSCSGAVGAVVSFFAGLAGSQAKDPCGAHTLEYQAPVLGSSFISLLSPQKSQEDTPDVVRRNEALAYMRAHLADPDLDTERIAAALNLSRRTLFRLFEGSGESVMGRLRSLRLERARQVLRTQVTTPVSTVALQLGFSGPVQFYRSFRTTVGMTPGEYRELAALEETKDQQS